MPVSVLVLAKAPVPGRVKTRLCPPATPPQAAALAAAALLDTLDAVNGLGGTPVIALDGLLTHATQGSEIAATLAGPVVRWHRIPQRGSDFAARLVNAHRDAHRVQPGQTVLQIAMDTPQATSGHLAEAASRLARPGCDAVLGRTPDGGWWLLGLRHPRATRLLLSVPMSTARTGELTMAALRRGGLRVDTVGPLTDVDTWNDARAVADAAPHTRFARSLRSMSVAPGQLAGAR